MSIFGSILSKLGIGKKEEAAPAPVAEASAPAVEAVPAPAAPVAISEVDVAAKLDGMDGSDSLNWQSSIVDMLKLLGLDSSYAARKDLAEEVGIAGYEGTAEQNIALHKAVLQKLAANGGTVPADLLA